MRSVQLRVCDMRPAPIEDPEAFMKDRGDKFIDAFSENILYNTGCGIDTGEKKARGLEKLLTDSIAGTMVLCFTEGGAVDLMKELADKGLFRRLDMVFGRNRAFPCGYHTAVFGPVIDSLDMSRFSSVLMYDSIDAGFAERLGALAPHAEIIPGRAYPIGCFASLALERRDIAAYYKALRSSERRFFNREELIDYLAAVTKTPVRMARLGERVMEELDFINANEGIRLIKDPPQRDLMESPTYAAAQRLRSREQ